MGSGRGEGGNVKWNWQREDWPRFSWSKRRLDRAEERFLRDGGVILGALQHLDEAQQVDIQVQAMSAEAVATSRIAGEAVDRHRVQSTIRRASGLATTRSRPSPAEQGIAEVMVDLFESHHENLDHLTLYAWHEMLMKGRTDLEDVGRYRRHREPMPVASGKRSRLHFEAPPSSRVADEMEAFLDWFNRTAPDAPDIPDEGHPPGERDAPDTPSTLHALVRSATAAVYLESIRPFEDGNGRIARALSAKALSQGLGKPVPLLLSTTLLEHRSPFDARLEAARKNNDMTEWTAWFAGVVLEAQQRTLALVEHTIDKGRLLESLRGDLSARQLKAMQRLLRPAAEVFDEGLSAAHYMSITQASPATATRDLADLVDKGALIRTGRQRHTRYHPNVPLRQVASVEIDTQGVIRQETNQ